MSVGNRSWQQDIAIRVAGIALWLAALLAIRQLFGLAHAAPHDWLPGEIGLAAVGFLGFSAGGVLAFLGTHIHDQVEIAVQWRPSGRSAGR